MALAESKGASCEGCKSSMSLDPAILVRRVLTRGISSSSSDPLEPLETNVLRDSKRMARPADDNSDILVQEDSWLPNAGCIAKDTDSAHNCDTHMTALPSGPCTQLGSARFSAKYAMTLVDSSQEASSSLLEPGIHRHWKLERAILAERRNLNQGTIIYQTDYKEFVHRLGLLLAEQPESGPLPLSVVKSLFYQRFGVTLCHKKLGHVTLSALCRCAAVAGGWSVVPQGRSHLLVPATPTSPGLAVTCEKEKLSLGGMA